MESLAKLITTADHYPFSAFCVFLGLWILLNIISGIVETIVINKQKK